MKQFNDFKLVLSVTTKSFLDRLSLLIKIFIGFLMVQVGYAGVNYLRTLHFVLHTSVLQNGVVQNSVLAAQPARIYNV